jgi:hypothetical protein
MEKLTQNEIERFKEILERNTPDLIKILQAKRNLVDDLRGREMTEKNLLLLELTTEKMCKIYLVKKTWDEINTIDLFCNPSDSLCEYVRSVIGLFKNLG